MKKFLLSLFFLTSFSFADILLYDNLYYGMNIDKIDLKDYKQVDPSIYKLSGIVYEKNATYEGSDVKEVLKFNNESKLDMVFFFKQHNNLDIDYLLSKPVSKKEIRYLGATISLNNDFEKFEINEVNKFKNDLSSKMIDLSFGSVLVSTTRFVQENKELNNISAADNYTGISKMSSCVKEQKHKECVKCEYVEGMDSNLSCSELYIYHPLVK